MAKIAPSILSADFSNLEQEIKKVEDFGADFIHIDVMDGNFVPNITLGPCVIESIRKVTNLPFDVHLMVENPERYLKDFAEAGADIISFHQEATHHVHRTIQDIKKLGIKAGVAINPATPVSLIEDILEEVDLILVMSVNPGFGGQSFIKSALKKISTLKQIILKNNYKTLIEVDGGINEDNAEKIVKAGADILVAGSAIYKSCDPKGVIKKLKLI
ncbi:ribulose-phosphate 3-epimerase [Thermovenabulum gondwanense]|uniref:Ribulose-phosphate 3-epimerase n=1 Tax=Thermovenabulum gondwanense TaxID=520767 RepID=A0A161PXS4_9FIRM|nr:ribulose-phosphate 3-epimerase [Thermovenabulum gondwanense]KYO66755.1 Ribulose-phosphate 3-epimerase [Thermovenabulum gondwanense]